MNNEKYWTYDRTLWCLFQILHHLLYLYYSFIITLNKDNAKTIIPRFYRSHRSVWWTTVSKETLKSKSAWMLHLPSALIHIKSLLTLHNSVSKEWNGLYSHSSTGKPSELFKCFSKCCRQAYSITMYKNNVLYKFRYEFKISRSLSFFSIGHTQEIFSHSGKVPNLKEQSTRSQ